MAFLLSKNSPFARFQSHPQISKEEQLILRRRFHIEPGAREKLLLAEDPALKRFKSYKNGVRRLKTIGDVLTLVVVSGCCYEIYVRAVMRKEAAEKQGLANSD